MRSSQGLASRLSVEHCRTTGRVTFQLDNVFWIECDSDQETRVRRLIYGREGLADTITAPEAHES